jgi:hypothetical protein
MLEVLSNSTESPTPNSNRWMHSGIEQDEEGEGGGEDYYDDDEDEDEESIETCSIGTMEDATAPHAFNIRIKVPYVMLYCAMFVGAHIETPWGAFIFHIQNRSVHVPTPPYINLLFYCIPLPIFLLHPPLIVTSLFVSLLLL